MATEVKHGPKPRFKARLQKDGSYTITIVGHYTKTDGLTAAGVTTYLFHSDRLDKQRAELLGLRSAFVGFFLEEWVARGGSWQEGMKAFRAYPFGKVRHGFLSHKDPRVRIHGRIGWRSFWATIKNAWHLLG